MSSIVALTATAALALSASSLPVRSRMLHAAAPFGQLPAVAGSPPLVARVHGLRMEAESDRAADEKTTASEMVNDEDTQAAPNAQPQEEEEEEEEDLLSSAAFLTQKLRVLETELAKIEEETAEYRAEADAQREEWASKRLRLQTDLENFQTRHKAQILDM